MITLPADIFASTGSDLVREFEEYGEIIAFDKEWNPFDIDDNMRYFYIILSGKVKVYQMRLSNTKEQTIYLMSKGDMFDTVVLLDGEVHEVMVDIIDEGRALKLPINKARAWMYDYPAFGEIVLKYVASQLREVEELASDLTLYDTQERLIKLIIQNIDRKDAAGNGLLDNLSHTELANLIGTVRHVVDRHMKKLKEEGVLENKRKKIILKDHAKLLEKIDSLE